MSNDSILYLIKAGFTFSFTYGIFYFFLRNKTFHTINRIVLLFIMLVSLVLPYLELVTALKSPVYSSTLVLGAYTNFSQFTVAAVKNISNNNFSYFTLLYMLYGAGLIIFGLRFFRQLLFIYQLKKQSKKHRINNIPVYLTKRNISPFSFFYWIFLPEDEKANNELYPIVEHERLHARHWHSLDILIVELFSIFLWFVPFVYSFKNSIKNVHEYIADNQTINNTGVTEYLKLLGSYSEKYVLIGLTNNFYCSTLKKRIIMITKNRTSNKHLLVYLLIIPAVVLITMAFNINKPLGQELANQTANTGTPHFIYPIEKTQFKLTSSFGMRMHPLKKKEMMHKGIDLAAKTGTSVKAAADGKIIKQEFSEKGHGNYVAIDHGNGYVTIYTQLSTFKSELGKQVKQGEVIGLVGSTGISTGPHLHFELRLNNEPLNPEEYLK